jgi:hypothetical protein
MASSLDSKPFFEARAKAIGLEDHVIKALKSAGVETLAGMAFWCTYQPGTPDDSVLVKAVAEAIQVDPVPPQTMIAVRRLHYESHTMFVADLRQRVVATDEDQPKRIPAAERASRHHDQKQRLPGLIMEGCHECSHSLLDLVMQQYEHDEVRWIPLASCTSREQELAGQKKDAYFALGSDGQLKVAPPRITAHADTTSDLKVKQAFTRRGLAYDQSNLIDFHVHAQWVELLFKAMGRSVPDNFSQITVQQCLDADKELFSKLADECRSGIVPLPGNVRPLDVAIKKWMHHPDVSYFILPFARPSGGSSSSTARQTEVSTDAQISNRKRKRLEREAAKGAKGKGKKGAKAAGKGLIDRRMPENCVNKTKEGKNLCFAFNSPNGCSYGAAGKSCMRGLHLCARPGCQEAHSAMNCKRTS